MRKTLMLSAVALVLGFVIGILCGSGFIRMAGTGTRKQTGATLSVPSTAPGGQSGLAAAEDGSLNTSDNVPLLTCGMEILGTIKARDYEALSGYVHPEFGVSFTAYSTVQPESDLRLSAAQIAGLSTDSTLYVWGTAAGSGEPIRMTGRDYFARYVYNADYIQAALIGVDTVVETGNALENVAESFPGCRFLEYHFPGLEPKNEGFDWCSLKLVLSPYQGEWRLVGLIHSEWTT